MIQWQRAWESDTWCETVGVEQPPWHEDGPRPSFDIPLGPRLQKNVRELVKRVQEADKKSKREEVWAAASYKSASEADREAKAYLQTWSKKVMCRDKFRVSQVVRDLLYDRGLDQWGRLRESGKRDVAQVSSDAAVEAGAKLTGSSRWT